MARIRPGFRLRRGQNLADLTAVAVARQNLGLGGAALKDVGEAPGALMPVGAFGLGGESPLLTRNQIDELSLSTLFKAGSGAFESFPETSQGVHVSCNGASAGMQIIAPTSAGNARLWVRTRTGGIWGIFTEMVTHAQFSNLFTNESVGQAVGGVGSFAFMAIDTAQIGGQTEPGDVHPGSRLRYFGLSESGGLRGVNPSGTWRCMGVTGSSTAAGTLWLRIA